jgi:hypothetical protein
VSDQRSHQTTHDADRGAGALQARRRRRGGFPMTQDHEIAHRPLPAVLKPVADELLLSWLWSGTQPTMASLRRSSRNG